MKEILISIRPQYVAKILNREKTSEVRKNMPKCELPCKVYIYCTSHNNYKDSLYLADDGKYYVDYYIPSEEDFVLNSKVIVEFTLNKAEKFECSSDAHNALVFDRKSCLSIQEVRDYCKGQDLFAWNIDDLKIYDEPKKLCEFKTQYGKIMQRPFQSWGYVKKLL